MIDFDILDPSTNVRGQAGVRDGEGNKKESNKEWKILIVGTEG